jgi:tRNA(Arg) A34 adenosine deaminase TadA
MHKHLQSALKLCATGDKRRKAFIAAVGLRTDGTLVSSLNGCSTEISPSSHAEARLVRKLGVGATVYVGRVLRLDGSVAMAKPCVRCENLLRHRGVKRVYYTIGPKEWGCLEF